MSIFNIGKQFSDDPSGRFYSDTKKRSGEEFREVHFRSLLAELKNNEKIIFILDDGVEGYGSSFLTEGFAGIVTYGYMQASALKDKIDFKYDDDDFSFYKEKIIQYIDEAEFGSEKYISTRPAQ
ncbi:STAS-like domain-containing protein [Photobacterium sp. OFAV2-7]|uniref:STAS-like domain-containing protein n=1 Tax=Photobacterium sp. OFAV2-7 TaxID=2917748 RepID=UPI001EF3ED80|nr:DUF4325 domain-containing protein [Photobacterium sp. OFAV2-7]MCG7586492.1 STAS-like domain-containing protein [Photobacterium sp. OFAV2-7]